MEPSSVTITPLSSNQWSIRVERQWKGHVAFGEVIVTQDTAPQADHPPHIALAGSRAWLDLARTRLAASDAEGAMASAQAGIAELGDTYYSSALGITEDTSLRIYLAEELADQGRLADAARELIKALEGRVQLYTQLHAETIAA
jgi:hypothetical protein